ncbi:hypothetical protein [Burkholderia cenocepacia]|uniref:hypothetical protein n=1 Tax=Burkholderia cenocepacia TaxID=95486 RepID=UPI002ABDD32E|nr:hypothetical protein [Burkholderia cenocepacia]
MRNRQADAAGLLSFFRDRFDLKSATVEELEFLSLASETASHELLSLSEQVSGIAGLIDIDRIQHSGAGCLQGESQAVLLWKIAREIEMIGRMNEIGSEAEYALRSRAETLTTSA